MAATETIITPRTAEVVTHASFETEGYQQAIISAAGLATTEEVDIFVMTPGGYAIWAGDGGAAVTLTAAKQAVVVPGGPRYAVLKDVTAGSVGVYVTRCGQGQ